MRCLLVDGNDAFLKAASVLLEREGMTVAGVASTSADALRQAQALRPAVSAGNPPAPWLHAMTGAAAA